MIRKIRNVYYLLLTYILYFVGDKLCYLNFVWAGVLYQKCMLLSFKYDEKINFKIWKDCEFKTKNVDDCD